MDTIDIGYTANVKINLKFQTWLLHANEYRLVDIKFVYILKAHGNI